jgi:hypothetical protein
MIPLASGPLASARLTFDGAAVAGDRQPLLCKLCHGQMTRTHGTAGGSMLMGSITPVNCHSQWHQTGGTGCRVVMVLLTIASLYLAISWSGDYAIAHLRVLRTYCSTK